MTESSINQKELNDLLFNLKTLEPKLQKSILNLAVKASAKDIQRSAKSIVPVGSGRLRDSIVVKKKTIREKRKDGQGKHTTVYKVGIKLDGKAWYAAMVEFGSKHAQPNPYMTPAFETNGRAAIDSMKAYIKLRFDRYMKKGLR